MSDQQEQMKNDSLLVDKAEIARFNALAEKWWDENGPMRPLHRINPTRLSFLRREFLKNFNLEDNSISPFKNLSLLDVGCGGGIVSEPIARQGFSVTGIDMAPATIAAAKIHAQKENLDIIYEEMAIENLPTSPTYDVILLLEIVEHVPDFAAIIKEASLRLKPNGIMVVSTINRTLKSFAFAIVGAEYVLRWLPRGTHQWNKFVTPEEVKSAFLASNMHPQTLSGMIFNPISNRWGMGKDCSVNYFYCATKVQQ